ncbi:hypothetical protein [Parvibaculum sp.]|uniref:hypothetical protein n=1 Tax=Parvibaculum sp. TaxID=2024848 RepID=UPI002B530E9A|nr:hypothetical protein [Parvibaculum sp.]HUD52786.1 hypothetical protein [Parvibaculum sp.]
MLARLFLTLRLRLLTIRPVPLPTAPRIAAPLARLLLPSLFLRARRLLATLLPLFALLRTISAAIAAPVPSPVAASIAVVPVLILPARRLCGAFIGAERADADQRRERDPN